MEHASSRADEKRAQDRRIAAGLLAGVLTLFAALLALTLTQKKPDYVLVLVTGDDCRRLFSDADCRAIVSRAQALHARTAPRFADLSTCTLVYGVGRCNAVVDNGVTLHLFAPSLAAIALTKNKDIVVPLHYGPLNEADTGVPQGGRAVYYRDRKLGSLAETTMGGAELPTLNGPSGEPLTAEELHRLGS